MDIECTALCRCIRHEGWPPTFPGACRGSGIKQRTSVSAGPCGHETEAARDYRLYTGPQYTVLSPRVRAHPFALRPQCGKLKRERKCRTESIYRQGDQRIGEVMLRRMDMTKETLHMCHKLYNII